MITAIMLLSLAAMTITLFSVTIANQARRTELAGDDAQLRQMLMAGAAAARVHITQSGRFEVPLPDALKRDSGELSVEIREEADGGRTAHVEAAIGRHHRSQVLTFSSRNGAWQIVDAYLEM